MLTLGEIAARITENESKYPNPPGEGYKKVLYLAPETIVWLYPELITGDLFGEMIFHGLSLYADFSLGPDDIRIEPFDANYGPVIKLSRVCHILEAWANVYMTPLDGEAKWETENREHFRAAWDIVWLAVRKSNLLSRMFFAGEGVRRVPCPVHKGRWSGCVWKDPECVTEENPQGCLSGSNVTGWLP
jgi:hypothetical protein